MLAAIPFFGLTVQNINVPGLGNLPIDPWAILVCLGFVVGLEIARARGLRLGIDPKDIVDGAIVIVGTGFLVAHIVTVLFYFPERLVTDEPMFGLMNPSGNGIWSILRFWEGFASTGGFIGAVIGAVLFYKVYAKKPDALRYADVITFGFPAGWFLGRVGCGVVHDHIGAPTTMPFGMDFDRGITNFYWALGDPYPGVSGVRHELGVYEAVAMIPVIAIFWWVGRKDRPPGTFLALFGLLYAPLRFVLDFLRNADLANQDLRYGALTPAQYGMIVMFLASAYLLWRLAKSDYQPLPMDGSPYQRERALGLPIPEPEAA